MKTVKLKIQNQIEIQEIQRIFNSVVKYSFNRFQDGFKEKEVRSSVNSLFKENSWILQCGIKVGLQLFKKHKNKKIVFGGKFLYSKYLKKLISKEEFKELRLLPLNIQGESCRGGNRLFNFDLLNNKLIFKHNKKDHQEIQLPTLRTNLKREFNQLQNLIDEKKITITISLSNTYISFTYDESLLDNTKFKNLKNNRVLGIDLNPNFIGLSVLEFNNKDEFNILHKQVFDLSKLNITSKESSEHNDSKYLTNKRQFELIQICHQIKDLVNVWKCKKLAIEDLNIKNSNKGKGKNFNRYCNNVWNRNLVLNKLKMFSNIYEFELVEVNPVYSSFIGNLQHGDSSTPDMVASSIEIARRGYNKFKKGWFYPELKLRSQDEQWKQTLDGVLTWKELFNKIKNLKMKYRVQLGDCISEAVFSKLYKKSNVHLYTF